MPTIHRIAVAGFFVVLVSQSFTRNVHWDEFYFLSHVHAWLNGRLDRPMQTFFVHGFGWLARVADDEISQIAAARLAMVACLAVTSFAIFRIAEAMTDSAAARLAVLGFLTSGFVLPFGASFRADPIAASLLMAAVALLMTSRLKLPALVFIALFSAVALLVTVKSALYLPVYAGALLYRAKQRGALLRILLAGCLALALAVVAYLWHASGLAVAPGNDTTTNALDAVSTTLLSGMIFPRSADILFWATLSLPVLFLAWKGLRANSRDRAKLVLWLFVAPLLSLVVYRNAFPYFFPFLAPPLAVVAAVGVRHLNRGSALNTTFTAMLALGLLQGILSVRETNFGQRSTLSEVHRLFPDPVPYIDQHGMVSTFPREGFFMSTWGLQNYRAAGKPVFADILAKTGPPLLLANRFELDQAVRHGDTRPGALLPEDQALLHESYVHYAGAIWLAGKTLVGTGREETIAVPIVGRYRIETSGSVMIDGRSFVSGDQLDLGSMSHRVTAPMGTRVQFVWAAAMVTQPPPDLAQQGLYSGFWRPF